MSDLTILTSADVDEVVETLDLQTAIKSQASIFKAFSTSSDSGSDVPTIQTPQRLTIQSEKATSLIMPARAGDQGTAIKIVSVPKGGGADGLPGTTLVMDANGRVEGVVNARKLTALRNACGSALFLQLCPQAEQPRHLMIFGSGAQAHSHAFVIARTLPTITLITLAVRSINDRATALLETLKRSLPNVQIELLSTRDGTGKVDLGDHIKTANIIVTVTSSTESLFPSHNVSPGTRLILVGSYTPKMREIDDDLVKRSGIIVVDSKSACGHEAGELISAGIGEDRMIELGSLVADENARQNVGEGGDVVIFKSVGLGIQDVAITRLVYDEAVKKGLGTTVKDYDA